MKRLSIITSFLIAFIVLAFLGGCSAGQSSASTTSTPPPTTSTSPAGPTFGSNAQSGQTTFASVCTQCHGANGQGVTAPAIIGASANLSKYTTAKALLDFISTAMPFNAPGSLSHQDYLNLLSYLLVQNNDVDPAAAFSEGALTGVQLK